MRILTPLTCFAAVAFVVGAAPVSLSSQTFAAITGTDAVITATPAPGTPRLTQPGHHAHTDAPLLYGRVRDGVYTVDGMVAKLRLNYDVNGAQYLYLFVPGVGTAVVSLTADPDSIVAEARLHDNELTFASGDRHFKLTGVALSDGKNEAPDHLYVRLDRAAWHLGRQPMVGFGNVAQLPYAWPGALPTSAPAEESRVIPPIPVTLLPSTTAVQPPAATPRPVSLR